jgi:hypothetical protein
MPHVPVKITAAYHGVPHHWLMARSLDKLFEKPQRVV